eukprot:Opistho-2@57135
MTKRGHKAPKKGKKEHTDTDATNGVKLNGGSKTADGASRAPRAQVVRTRTFDKAVNAAVTSEGASADTADQAKRPAESVADNTKDTKAAADDSATHEDKSADEKARPSGKWSLLGYVGVAAAVAIVAVLVIRRGHLVRK